MKKKKRHGSASSRVAAALRMAALSLRHSQTALGAYYRQIARHKGDDVAVFATARKLATLIYRMLRWGQNYVDEGAEAYEKRYREARLRRLTTTAKELGYQLAPLTPQPRDALRLTKSQVSLATGCAGINQAVTRNNFALKINNLAASHRREARSISASQSGRAAKSALSHSGLG